MPRRVAETSSNGLIEACIEACHACVAACETIRSQQFVDDERALKAVNDCGRYAMAMADLLRRKPALAQDVGEVCLEACRACAETCRESRLGPPLAAIGKESERCAEACRQLLDALAGKAENFSA